jgi:hypothetical protein
MTSKGTFTEKYSYYDGHYPEPNANISPEEHERRCKEFEEMDKNLSSWEEAWELSSHSNPNEK